MASAEDVMLLHLMHYQRQGNNPDDQWNDILGILKVQALTMDLAYLHHQAKERDFQELLSQALIDAGIYDKEPYSLQKSSF